MNRIIQVALLVIVWPSAFNTEILQAADPNSQTEECETEVRKLKVEILRLNEELRVQRDEIRRLKVLCRKAGINPDVKNDKDVEEPDRKPLEHVVLNEKVYDVPINPDVKNDKDVKESDRKPLEYVVLNEEVHDVPIKTQVQLDILLSGEITEKALRALLKNLYSSIKTRKGFKYHEHPTNIYIYAYTSRAQQQSSMGLWAGMLALSYGDKTPTIKIDKEYLTTIKAGPEKKFGLSETQRMQIFREIVKAEDDAMNAAINKYPNDGMKQIDYERQQAKANKENLRKKYRLSKEELDKIGFEGVMKKWPMP